MISDNYYGYCKKEVKTQISYAANLMGNVEEEHSGGALVFQSWSLGETFQANSKRYNGRTFDDVIRDYGSWIDVRPEGYGIDRNFPELFYIPENARADLRQQNVTWTRGGDRARDSAAARQRLHGSVGIPNSSGEASRRAQLADHRHSRRGNVLP